MISPLPPGGHHNPFAIPLQSRSQGADTQVIEWNRNWPLVPWSMRRHGELFALVDDLAEQIRRFRIEGPQPGALRNVKADTGHLVVISGTEGAGKTSLIHYCVNDLLTRLRGDERAAPPAPPAPETAVSSPPAVKVIDVAGELNDGDKISRPEGQFTGLKAINRSIYREALRILQRRADSAFGKASRSDGRKALHSENLMECYDELSRLLLDLDWIALVIVPNIQWRDGDLVRRFLRSCSSYSTPRVVFFVEITNTKTEMDELLRAEFGLRLKRHITHLPIGDLKNPDCSTFIEKRLAAAAGNTNHIRVAADAVHSLQAQRDYGCVWELQSIFHGAAEEAWQDGVSVIDEARLRRYRAARDREQKESLAREPRAGGQGSSR